MLTTMVDVSAKDVGTGPRAEDHDHVVVGTLERRDRQDDEGRRKPRRRGRKKKAAIEARNRLDGLVYSVEKTLGENKDKVDAAAVTEIEAAIAESKTALGTEDTAAMDNAFERLQTASHKLAEALYSQTAAGGDAPAEEQASSATAGADGDGGTAASDDNVIDAEYVDVEDEEKK